MLKTLWVVYVSVFLAELGDKTQVATLLFATDSNLSPMGVFVASSLALMTSSLLMVLFGEQIARVVPPAAIRTAAGIGFILIGVWTLARPA